MYFIREAPYRLYAGTGLFFRIIQRGVTPKNPISKVNVILNVA